MNRYSESKTPHIHAAESVSDVMAKAVGALLPAIIVALIFFRLDAFRLVLVSLAGGFLGEVAGGKLFRIKISLGNGSTIFTALLFSLLLPPDLVSWVAALGAFFAVFAGKMCFGGLGSNPFNPALIGRIFLGISFPQAMNWPAMVEMPGASAVWIAALGIGGLFILWLGKTDWSRPICYFVSGTIFSLLFGLSPSFFLTANLTCLAAFFIITDPVTTPLEKQAARLFSFLCAGAAIFLKSRGASYLQSTLYAILMMNVLVPWMDAWFNARKRVKK